MEFIRKIVDKEKDNSQLAIPASIQPFGDKDHISCDGESVPIAMAM